MVKGFQCHSIYLPQLLEKKQLQKKKSHVIQTFSLVALIHNTFTQLDMPTQDLFSWLV